MREISLTLNLPVICSGFFIFQYTYFRTLMQLKLIIKNWKFIAFLSLITVFVIMVIDVFFVAFFPKEGLVVLTMIEYIAVGILGLDLIQQYMKARNKPKFMQKNWIFILTFIPYLIFVKVAGILMIIKTVIHFVARAGKLVLHTKTIKKELKKIYESVKTPQEKKAP